MISDWATDTKPIKRLFYKGSFPIMIDKIIA